MKFRVKAENMKFDESAASVANLDPEALERFSKFADLLAAQNEVMNLVADARREVVEIRHFLDSLSLLPVIRDQLPEAGTLIDVGTGAGFPGLPIAIARPEWKVTLLDSLGKRCVFLEETAAALKLENVTVVHARAEEAARGELRSSFDAVVSRAVAKLPVLCEFCLPYLKPGGMFFSMKSRHAEEELVQSRAALQKLNAECAGRYDYSLPSFPGEEQGMELTVFLFRKTGTTPDRFPRAYGTIKKKPL